MSTLENDVAVLRLESPLGFSETVRPVCLPNFNFNYAGLYGTAVGWGSLAEEYQSGKPVVNPLNEVDVKIWDNAQCTEPYGGRIFDTMLCANGKGKDACS